MFNNRTARALAHAQVQWIEFAFKASNTRLTAKVQDCLHAHKILKSDNDILITKVGSATIAVHADHAVSVKDNLVVPGVDHDGKRGYLVLDCKHTPVYSVCATADEAYAEVLHA